MRQGGATSPGVRAHLSLSKCLPQVLGRLKGRDVLGGQVPSPQPLPTGLRSLLQVVTAETLLDLSDLSENDEASPAQEVSRVPHGQPRPWREGWATCLLLRGQGFRLEDVDWNAIAHRFPNLLASMQSSLDFK